MTEKKPSNLKWVLLVIVALSFLVPLVIFPLVKQRDQEPPQKISEGSTDLTSPTAGSLSIGGGTLPESFESAREGAFWIGGGTVVKKHATDGEYSFHVAFKSYTLTGKRSGMFSRPMALKTSLTPNSRMLLDVTNLNEPFSVTLILQGSRGKSRYYPDVPIPLGVSTLEFNLATPQNQTDAIDLSSVSHFHLVYANSKIERTVEAYFDNIRLGTEGTLSMGTGKEPTFIHDSENYFPDGEFQLGFGTWHPRVYSGSGWRFSIVRGENAYDGITSLGIFGLIKGAAEIVSPELELEPGSHVLSFVVKGLKDMKYDIMVEEFRNNNWVRMVRNEHPVAAPLKWQSIERQIIVKPKDPNPRKLRIRIIASGIGNLYLDSIRLVSKDGKSPQHDQFGIESEVKTTVSDNSKISTPGWNGSNFEYQGQQVFPLLYRHDDLPLTEASRVFNEKFSSLKLMSAIDLGGVFHGGGLKKILKRAERHWANEAVAFWLLSGDVNWKLAGELPAKTRGTVRAIQERDPRLVFVGIGIDSPSLAYYNFSDTTDGFLVGGPVTKASESSFNKFIAALETALEACGPDQPLLAQIDSRTSIHAKLLLAHISWIYGVDGFVFSRFQRQSEDFIATLPMDWNEFESFLSEVSGLLDTMKKKAPSLLNEKSPRVIRTTDSILYREGKTVEGERVLLIANLSAREVPEASLETSGGRVKVDLAPWEGRIVFPAEK